MPDRSREAQIAMLGERHWYSLVSAAPVPENGETVNVALVYGNGRAFYLDFVDTLPRLSCLVPKEELSVYAAILEGCKDRVDRGIDPLELSSLLGPQLFLRPPRVLFADMSDDLVAQFRERFLTSPKGARPADEDALVRRSRQQLDLAIRRTSFPNGLVAKDVGPKQLYEGKFEVLAGHRVPRLSRALRNRGRDLLLDSVAIERPYQARDIREVAGRITQAFFVYDRNREAIRRRMGIEIRMAGILYPLPDEATADLVDLYELTRKTWTDQSARVITGSIDEIGDQLRSDADWVRAGAVGE